MHKITAPDEAWLSATLSDDFPVYVDRRTGAKLVTQHYFPVSPRTLEVWPLTWRRVNGKAITKTAELMAVAQAMLESATPIRGGSRGRT